MPHKQASTNFLNQESFKWQRNCFLPWDFGPKLIQKDLKWERKQKILLKLEVKFQQSGLTAHRMAIPWLTVDGYNIHHHMVYLWKFRLNLKAAKTPFASDCPMSQLLPSTNLRTVVILLEHRNINKGSIRKVWCLLHSGWITTIHKFVAIWAVQCKRFRWGDPNPFTFSTTYNPTLSWNTVSIVHHYT